MSEFVFNDIFGNERARDLYATDREFSYFTTILKLHNKYYEDSSTYNRIFSPHKGLHRLSPVRKDRDSSFTYYNA